jgi:hypothetical protein
MPGRHWGLNIVRPVHVIVIYTQGFFRAIDPRTVLMSGIPMQTILSLATAEHLR